MVDIKSLLQHGENENLEVTSAEKGLPKSLWETYSAFANTNGGIILLGVKETVNGFEIIGVSDHEKYIEEIWANLHNRTKTSANILLNHHVYMQEIEKKSVIVIEVPRANRRDKPILSMMIYFMVPIEEIMLEITIVFVRMSKIWFVIMRMLPKI